MIHLARWKIVLILAVVALSILYSMPNVAGTQGRAWLATLPEWVPHKTVNLGLDLQGGAHLLLKVEVGEVISQRSEDLEDSARAALRKEKIAYTRIAGIPGGIKLTLQEEQDVEQVRKIFRNIDADLEITVSDDRMSVEAVYNEAALKAIRDQTIGQSIEIVRRRIDETGTKEPIIQRQGEDRIVVQLPGVDNPERIKEILKTTAKLTFHLVDMGTGGTAGGGKRMLPMAEDPAQTVPIQRREMLTGDMLTNAQPAFEQGMPVVSFRLNGIGAKKFCDVTRDNVGKPFAIVLDNKVISAPRINGAICGGAAIITGQFSVQETNDLSLLLRAGALPASLSIMEERTVGPTLGSDSVKAGRKACLMALLFVMIFAIASYGLFGIFASVGLLVNMTMIFAVMSILQATLTLPGIAGIVLTIGLAVDGNVLVFERIKEELRSGRGIMAAIDTGYTRAKTTITDSNCTALIAALILFSFGTGPIKGFAVTMSIGVVTSYFCALMLTRLIVLTWLRVKKPKEITV